MHAYRLARIQGEMQQGNKYVAEGNAFNLLAQLSGKLSWDALKHREKNKSRDRMRLDTLFKCPHIAEQEMKNYEEHTVNCH